MSLALALRLGGALAVALFLAAIAALVIDRNHLAQLNGRHVACAAAVAGKLGAQPVQAVCDATIIKAATDAGQARACDAALSQASKGAPAVCSAPVQRLAAARDAFADEVADRDAQLAHARTDQAAAVSRASTRATTLAKQDAHADQVLRSAPRTGGGDLVLDADRLRDLAGPDPAGGRLAGGGDPR